MAILRAALPRTALGLAVLAVCSACTVHKVLPDRTVTVTPTPLPSSSASTPASPSASTTAPGGSVTTTPASMPRFTSDCTTLPVGAVEAVIGGDLPGLTQFVVGTPDPATGRVSYLNCRYGVASANADPGLEIGVSLYRTAAQATARIAPTVSDYEAHGATATPTTVSGIPATLLVGGTGTGYEPAIVLALGQRTVAISATTTVVPAAAQATKLAALAVYVLNKTAG